MAKDPVEIMRSCLGAVIEGLEIDHQAEKVIITLNKGVIELDGESLEMYIDLDEYKQ
jgi:hypothetical protein